MNAIQKWIFKKLLRYYRNEIKNYRLKPVLIDQHQIIDECYSCLWDPKVGSLIRRQYQFINNPINNVSLTDKIHFSNRIHESMKRRYNDQTLPENPDNNLGYFKPLEAEFRRDRMTFNGVARIWSRYSGSSELPPTHIGVGHGSGQTNDDSSALEDEDSYEALDGNGSMTPSGSIIRFQATFDILVPTFLMREVGIFAGHPDGQLQARALFENPLQHTYGENYPGSDYTIYTLTA